MELIMQISAKKIYRAATAKERDTDDNARSIK